MTNSLINRLLVYYQPIILVITGFLLLITIAYLNWYPRVKSTFVRWIQNRLYRNSPGSDVMADGIFMTVTSYTLAIGLGLLVIGGIYLSGIIF